MTENFTARNIGDCGCWFTRGWWTCAICNVAIEPDVPIVKYYKLETAVRKYIPKRFPRLVMGRTMEDIIMEYVGPEHFEWIHQGCCPDISCEGTVFAAAVPQKNKKKFVVSNEELTCQHALTEQFEDAKCESDDEVKSSGSERSVTFSDEVEIYEVPNRQQEDRYGTWMADGIRERMAEQREVEG